MKYLLTFYNDESLRDEVRPEEMAPALARWREFDREAREAGALLACEPLERTATATTIAVTDDGKQPATDGPFAETKEQLGGFCLLECESREEALAWADKVPLGVPGKIELRAVADYSGIHSEHPAEAAEAMPR